MKPEKIPNIERQKNKGKQNKCKADIGRRLGDVILVIRSNLNRSCLEVPVRFGAGSRDRT